MDCSREEREPVIPSIGMPEPGEEEWGHNDSGRATSKRNMVEGRKKIKPARGVESCCEGSGLPHGEVGLHP